MNDKEIVKYYKIYGYDNGSHSCPLLCIVIAKDKSQAEEYANTLPRYKDSWCGKGYVAEVKVVDLVGD